MTIEIAPGSSAESGPSQLFGQLGEQMALLLKQEVQLAQLELANKVREATRRAWVIVIGVSVAVLGAQTLAIATVIALTDAMPLLSAALTVGAILAATGAVLITVGRILWARMNFAPERTMETLKEGTAWAQRLVR